MTQMPQLPQDKVPLKGASRPCDSGLPGRADPPLNHDLTSQVLPTSLRLPERGHRTRQDASREEGDRERWPTAGFETRQIPRPEP